MQDTFDDLEIDSNSHPPVQSGATGSAYAPVINGSRPDRGVPIMQSLSNTTARGQVVGCGLPVVASIYNPTILPASYTIHPPHGIFGTIPSPMSPGPGIAPGPSNHYFSAPQVLRARVHGPNYGMTLSEVSGTNSGFTPLPPAMVPIPTHPEAVHSGFIEATTAFQGTHVWADGFSTSLTGQGLPYKVLPQNIYDRGLASEAFHLPEMMFQGINLGDAHRSDFRSLMDGDQGAWPMSSSSEVRQKLAIVFCFPGHDKYSRQVNVHRHIGARRVPHTRSKLAHIVAVEMQAFLSLTRSCGKPLMYGGRELDLDDLVLIDIQHISRGSLQPTIGVIIGHPRAEIRD